MFIRKEFIGEVREINESKMTLTAYVSTGKKDRYGETIPPGEWILGHYRKNPILLWAHDSWEPPVGKAEWIKTDEKGLLSKIRFADTVRGNEIFYLYKEGMLNAFSVGFRATRDEKDPTIFRKCELYENSCVPIPANVEALAERMTQVGVEKRVGEETLELIARSAEDRKRHEEIDTKIEKPAKDPKEGEETVTSSVDPREQIKETNKLIKESQEENGRLLEEIGRLKAIHIPPLADPDKPEQKTVKLDKQRKGRIIHNKAGQEEKMPGISGDTVRSVVAKAIKEINLKEIVAGEVRRLTGKVG